MPKYPTIQEAARVSRLEPPTGIIRIVLDTDTYNEVDDQFALVYALQSALQSPEHLSVEAIYAAPFHNNRSTGPADGMERSYDEIMRVLDFSKLAPQDGVYKGSPGYLKPDNQPWESPAAADLVERAMRSPVEDPLYVVAIGAITNVTSAILLEPAIIERIVVVWLGGHALHWPHTREFNLMQDVPAAQVLFDCGVPLVQIPCMGVTTHLATTIPELEILSFRPQPHRRLPGGNRQRLRKRSLRLVQGHLGCSRHRLPDQRCLGAHKSCPQPNPHF